MNTKKLVRRTLGDGTSKYSSTNPSGWTRTIEEALQYDEDLAQRVAFHAHQMSGENVEVVDAPASSGQGVDND